MRRTSAQLPPTPRQLEVLRAIHGILSTPLEPFTWRGLGRSLGISSTSAISDAIALLERKGLLLYRRAQGGRGGRRVAAVTLTPAGLVAIGVSCCASCGQPLPLPATTKTEAA